ncbi:aminotransferase-like domain-containing protein [Alkaliphilus serpentinus]|uniref:PLP-dependent aminotransferase family protein n=1 Tax=Alkaliphilus serpentinus TaxID=1482731 RepID=A0A833M8G1_9FIRM|nr:PLP-dependent aminotransferase family protein [Alkaliphilus serpentinus]KAB3532843.1 PLP-dependent aminotransferase family protein [Alkaliphilus serpentinus]
MENSKIDMVKDYIFNEVKAGRIKKGQRLPSCRELSAQLSINKITVNKAYNQLERDHRVYSIPRGGFYLVDSDETSTNKGNVVDFQNVRPDDKLIPYREFTHAINRAVDLHKNSLFGYETPEGLPSLRTTLKHQFEKDGVYTSDDKILITHGAQQAIALVLQAVFLNSKGKLLVEAPTYNLVLRMAKHLGISVVGIKRMADGYDYKEMERLFKSGEIAAFYVIPRHHNPMGYSLSERDKQKIADLTNKYQILVIEDDYLADLGSKKGFLPIHYYDIKKTTVYIRSFSKTFMPGIRLGAAIVPEAIRQEILDLKHVSDLNTSRIPQAALDIFIRSGMYQKHIKRVRKSYEAKLRKSAEIFKGLSPKGLYYHIPDHGIFIWLELPKDVYGLALEKKLLQVGIKVKEASEFFPEGWLTENQCHNIFIRLCISGVDYDGLDALTQLLSAIRPDEAPIF